MISSIYHFPFAAFGFSYQEMIFLLCGIGLVFISGDVVDILAKTVEIKIQDLIFVSLTLLGEDWALHIARHETT